VELALREHAASQFAHQPVDLAQVQASFLGVIHGMAGVAFVSEEGGQLRGL